jgi:glycosyltransferase involved in cell wall biosynthesis
MLACIPPPAEEGAYKVPRALLLFEPPDGGAPEVVLNLALSMERHGWSARVAGPEQASIRARLEQAGIEYLPVSHLKRGSRSPLSDLRALRSLDRTLARDPVDVIHCHSSKAGVIGRVLGARHRTPVVYSPHCFAFLRDLGRLSRTAPALIERMLAPLTSAYVCVCESERRAALKLGLAPPERTHRIYNGVPDPLPNAGPERALMEFKGDGLLVGAVTVLRRQKRLDVLIDAIPTVLAQVPQARFAIVGNGPMQDKLKERAAANGLADNPRFAFFPFTPPSDRYMGALDLYVLSSAWEAMPVGVLEALSWGVPQVVTDVGGTIEAVTDETGKLVPAKQPDALAGAIVEMLGDPRLCASARVASRERHRAMFDSQRMVRETVGVYQSVLAERAPAGEAETAPAESALAGHVRGKPAVAEPVPARPALAEPAIAERALGMTGTLDAASEARVVAPLS